MTVGTDSGALGGRYRNGHPQEKEEAKFLDVCVLGI